MTLFSKPQEIHFSKATVKDCFQLTSLLFCWEKNTARNPEFDCDRFGLAYMDNREIVLQNSLRVRKVSLINIEFVYWHLILFDLSHD